MINISASSLKDFLTCPAKLYYKVNFPDTSVLSKELQIGLFVHDIIEHTATLSSEEREYYLQDNLNKYNFQGTDFEVIDRCIQNYEKNFTNMVSDDDLVEQSFSFGNGEYNIRGRFDRIIGGGSTIIDWKTSRKPPKSIDTDVQFILYYEAFKHLYGHYPANVLYIALQTGNIIRFNPIKAYIDSLYNEVIPNYINFITRQSYPRYGLYSNYACGFCQYKKVCYDELDSGVLHN